MRLYDTGRPMKSLIGGNNRPDPINQQCLFTIFIGQSFFFFLYQLHMNHTSVILPIIHYHARTLILCLYAHTLHRGLFYSVAQISLYTSLNLQVTLGLKVLDRYSQHGLLIVLHLLFVKHLTTFPII